MAASRFSADLIFDLGLHTGEDTDYYLKKGFRVVAVEANPQLASTAREKFAAQPQDGDLTLVEAAISDKDGMIDFYVNNKNTAWSSIFEKHGNKMHGAHKITVTTRRLEDIIAEYGVPYYLEIDIEGADRIAVSSLASLDVRPAFVSVEGGGPVLLRKLGDLGYDRFAIVNQAEVPKKTCPNPPLEGQYTQHVFPSGASGLFGRELTEPWITLEEAVRQREEFGKAILELRCQNDNEMAARRRLGIGWYDVHATRQEFLSAPTRA